jgi:hypothetical protein
MGNFSNKDKKLKLIIRVRIYHPEFYTLENIINKET